MLFPGLAWQSKERVKSGKILAIAWLIPQLFEHESLELRNCELLGCRVNELENVQAVVSDKVEELVHYKGQPFLLINSDITLISEDADKLSLFNFVFSLSHLIKAVVDFLRSVTWDLNLLSR